jgi:hypothetical protein
MDYSIIHSTHLSVQCLMCDILAHRTDRFLVSIARQIACRVYSGQLGQYILVHGSLQTAVYTGIS